MSKPEFEVDSVPGTFFSIKAFSSMATAVVNTYEEGMHTVGASNGYTDYILWQVCDDQPDSVYFECNDEINSGYDLVSECTVDLDGCHVVLNNGAIIHFYWYPSRHPELTAFVNGLRTIYVSAPRILEAHDIP